MQHPIRLEQVLAGPSLALGLLAGCASTTYQETEPGHASRVEVTYGVRDFDNDFEPVDDQDAFGVLFKFQRMGDVLGFEVGAIYSEEDKHKTGTDFEMKAAEIFAGGHHEFDTWRGWLHPYFGAGLSFLDAKFEVDSDSEHDGTLGIYGHFGAYAKVGGGITLGLDYRAMFGGDLDFGDGDEDSDYGMIAVTAGVGF